MKKMLCGAVLLPFIGVQAASITPYLLLNKEYRYVSQDDAANKGNWTGVTDVDGFETRLGVKGNSKLNGNLVAAGKIELGINSQKDNGAGENIRIRLAQIDLSGKFGKITVGKHWNPNSLRMLGLDPFTATGAQLLGLDSKDIDGAVAGNFGMKARYFNDGFTYYTPDFSGVKLSVTADQSSDTLVKDADGDTQKWTTAVLTFDKKFGNYQLNSHITYAMGDFEGDGSNLDNDQNFITVGLKFSSELFGVSFAYTKEDRGEALNSSNKTVDVERNHMLAAAWYNYKKFTFGLNYGKTEFGEDADTIDGVDYKNGEQSQVAVGVIYKLSNNFKTRLIYKNQKTTANQAIVGTSKENKADVVLAGITATF